MQLNEHPLWFRSIKRKNAVKYLVIPTAFRLIIICRVRVVFTESFDAHSYDKYFRFPRSTADPDDKFHFLNLVTTFCSIRTINPSGLRLDVPLERRLNLLKDPFYLPVNQDQTIL